MNILLTSFHDYTKFRNITDRPKLLNESTTIPSLTLMQLASLMPEKHFLTALDNPLNINFDGEYDLIGINTVTTTANYAYRVADKFRKMGKTVVIGGIHSSALPFEAKEHADSVIIGEAEDTWPQLLEDYELGKLKSFYKQEKPVDLNLIPRPKRDIFKNSYKIAPIEISRGCPVGCEFCSITNTSFGKIFRTKSVENIVDEVRDIPQKYLWLCDPSLTTKPEFTKAIFRKLIDFDKKLIKCNANVNVLAKDDELLRLASEAGCLEWLVGFDSVSQKSLIKSGKKTNKVQEYHKAIKKIHDHGMMIMGSLIFGFDTDTPDIFNISDEFVTESEIDVIPINILTPYPGTPLYNNLHSEGRILTNDWSKYTTRDVVFQPKNMTPDELLNNTLELHRKWYKVSRCMKRTIGSANLGFYPFLETAKLNIYSKVTKIF